MTERLKKYILFFYLFITIYKYAFLLNFKKIEINKNYLIIQKNLNLTFNSNIKKN